MELEEPLDAFACLGGHLGCLGGSGEAEDEVELAPAGDLDDTGELHLTQLDGRPSEGAHDGDGVLGVDEQAHPGEHVAYLGSLEKRAGLLCRGCLLRTGLPINRRLGPGRDRELRAGRAVWRRGGGSGARHKIKDTRGDSWSAAGRGYA